jgi:hypothetical protein
VRAHVALGARVHVTSMSSNRAITPGVVRANGPSRPRNAGRYRPLCISRHGVNCALTLAVTYT